MDFQKSDSIQTEPWWVEAAIRQDVVRHELVVHGLLVERAVSGFAAHATACAVVHRVPG